MAKIEQYLKVVQRFLTLCHKFAVLWCIETEIKFYYYFYADDFNY